MRCVKDVRERCRVSRLGTRRVLTVGRVDPFEPRVAVQFGVGLHTGVVMFGRRKRDRDARRVVLASDRHDGANFRACRLVALDLRYKRFKSANFEFADLTESDLRGANLSVANLRGACLTGAQLQNTILAGANFDDATVIATNFDGATFDDTTFDRAIWDQATIWPAGYRPPRSRETR